LLPCFHFPSFSFLLLFTCLSLVAVVARDRLSDRLRLRSLRPPPHIVTTHSFEVCLAAPSVALPMANPLRRINDVNLNGYNSGPPLRGRGVPSPKVGTKAGSTLVVGWVGGI